MTNPMTPSNRDAPAETPDEGLQRIARELASRQVSLPADMQAVIDENLPELLERDMTGTPYNPNINERPGPMPQRAIREYETPRRRLAVEALLSLGWKWNGEQWIAPPAPGTVTDEMVSRAVSEWYRQRGTYEGETPVDHEDMRAALEAALAAEIPADLLQRMDTLHEKMDANKARDADAEIPENLEDIVKAFIRKHDIHSAESIYQMDSIIEDAYSLIEQLCDAVGYLPLDGERE